MTKPRKKRRSGQQNRGQIGPQIDPSYRRRYPLQGRDDNFRILVKTLYGILQCIHHCSLLKSQSDGHFGKAFRLKVNELNKFVKAGNSTPKVKQDIERVNERWAAEISKTLFKHYTDQLSKFTETAHNLIFGHTLDHERAKQIALSWAQRNYKKKLDKSTVTRFKTTLNDICSTDPLVPAPQGGASPNGNGTRVTGASNLPFRPPPPAVPGPSNRSPTYVDAVLSRPKTAVLPPPVGNTDSISAKSSSTTGGPRTPSPLAQPAPTQRLSGQNYNSTKKRNPTSGRNLRPRKLAYQERSPTMGSNQNSSDGDSRGQSHVWRAPSSNQNSNDGNSRGQSHVWRAPNVGIYKDRDWVFPDSQITPLARTVVIGDSNIDKIKPPPPDPSVTLLSFPGAKFRNFLKLFKQAGVHTQVERVVFSCGINDRGCKSIPYVLSQFKRTAAAMRKTFPQASVFFVTLQCDTALPSQDIQNVAEFKQLVKTDKAVPGLVHLIPPVATSAFRTGADRIHWAAQTANTLFKHWMQFINHPQKN